MNRLLLIQSKNIIILLLYLTVFFHKAGLAQNNNIDSIIINYPPTKTDIINKAKNILLDEVIACDKNTKIISEVQKYINTNENNSYFNFLSIYENFLLYVYTNSWDSVFSYIENKILPNSNIRGRYFDYNIYTANANRFSSLLYWKLIEKIFVEDNMNAINNEILLSDLSNEQKEFLKIYLLYYLNVENINHRTTLRNEYLDTLSPIYKQFIKDYPASKYKVYVFIYDTKPSNIQYEFGLGFGVVLYSGNISKNFISPPVIPINFNFYHKKLFLGLNINLIFNELKQDIVIQKDTTFVWNKDKNNVSSLNFSFAIGYNIIRKKHFALSPVIGTNYISFKPKENAEKPELQKINYVSNSLSIGFDFKYFTRTASWLLFYDDKYFGTNLSYRFNYGKPFNNPEIVKGDLHTITLSFFINSKRNKHIKI